MTQRELSKQLNISPATLSLILNNRPGVSPVTKERVLNELKSMGYPISRRPTSSDANICFVVYKKDGRVLDSSPFTTLIAENVESRAQKFGFNLLYMTIQCQKPLEEQIQRLQTMNCQGAVVFATEMSNEDIPQFEQMPFPVVFLDNDFPFANVDSVGVNHVLSTFQAIEYLYSLGHREIGYLQSAASINSFLDREQGYRNAMKHFGLKLEERNVFRLGYSEEASFQDFRKILPTLSSLPTAFFTDDDLIAAGVLRALTEGGVSVPEEVSILGMNDRPLCAMTNPPLTTIRIPKYSFGGIAIDLLVSRIQDFDLQSDNINSYKYFFGSELMIRQSVRSLL